MIGRATAATVLALVLSAGAMAGEYAVTVAEPVLKLPEVRRLVLVPAGSPGPADKKCKPAAEVATYGKATEPAGEGPYDLWWEPKAGVPVRLMAGLTLPAGKPMVVKVEETAGVVRVRGDSLPRVKLLALTAVNGPGPDDEGFAPVQTADAIKVNMLVPAGFYTLWAKPANGARATKSDDRLRVLAGKVVEVE